MSPQTASASARRRSSRSGAVSRRRAAARARTRRRRAALALTLGTAVVIAIVLVLPLAQKAVNDLSLPLSYPAVIRQQASEKHLDPALVAAVIYAETKFDPRTSSAGAEGLMQLMPQTADFLAHRSGATTFTTADLGEPQVNIAYGSYYLRYLLNEFHGNVMAALAAYNGGETNVHEWMAQARAAGHAFGVSDIPFPETRDYVQRVLQAQAEYRRTYAAQLGYT